ncbi:MAG TPA: TetR/AcrR family transcriptional regulator [Prolixibacteraceae bacterium]|nr:TetR/AcrR family transcriptional regulator [Prolixibacteraceae bacterium]
MSPRSSKQFDDIRKQKKKLIMETALELFAEQGFHATSVSQIAQKAGISKGLTYNYFESKDDILHEIIEEGFKSIYSNFDINHDGVLTDDEYIYFIRQSFRIISENRNFWKLYFTIMIQHNVANLFEGEYIEKTQPILTTLLDFIKAKGSSDPEADILAIGSMLKGAYLMVVTSSDFFPADKLENAIIDASFKIMQSHNKSKIKQS